MRHCLEAGVPTFKTCVEREAVPPLRELAGYRSASAGDEVSRMVREEATACLKVLYAEEALGDRQETRRFAEPSRANFSYEYARDAVAPGANQT
ncbi:MAG: uncharacterized protein KVP18_000564 [Porospora cf. gigantea A]|nr:MAG: hypothetical protein KVP18_000564 [Porospora cf. gigantea A]